MHINEKISLLHGAPKKDFFDLLKKQGVRQVFVMEGRPHLKNLGQNCRMLLERKIQPIVISDNMAGFLFFRNHVKNVWLACQQFRGKEALCPIGSLILAVLAKRHKVNISIVSAREKSGFYGRAKDLMVFQKKRVAAKGIKGYVPLCELVPRHYITRMAL